MESDKPGFMHSFIEVFINYLLSSSCVLVPVLGARDTAKDPNKVPTILEATFSWRKSDNKSTNIIWQMVICALKKKRVA